jgi:uncharacterized integral membrane protein (TIGR00698 family)
MMNGDHPGTLGLVVAAIARVVPPKVRPELRSIVPGAGVSVGLGILAYQITPAINHVMGGVAAGQFKLSAIIVVLALGVALHRFIPASLIEPGLNWCVKRLLRVAIALLGIRLTLFDVLDLGAAVAATVIASMMLTAGFGVWMARRLEVDARYGVLAGAANAVCGASATLAVATVVPAYSRKNADIAFTILAANAFSTVAMILYPAIAGILGYDAQRTGILLGATIHDMAQVVGAGYALSDQVGDTAVVVKLFRVLLLLPLALIVGWFFAQRAGPGDRGMVPFPGFAVAFLVLCTINSMTPMLGELTPTYRLVKATLLELSSWGLLTSMAALGLGTSLSALAGIGWRHIAVFLACTLLILCTVVAALSVG